MKNQSPAQIQRQRSMFRDNGKYALVNPCNCCGKSAGVDYESHPETDNKWNDEAICLCERCYEVTKHMTEVDDFEAYRKETFGNAAEIANEKYCRQVCKI